MSTVLIAGRVFRCTQHGSAMLSLKSLVIHLLSLRRAKSGLCQESSPIAQTHAFFPFFNFVMIVAQYTRITDFDYFLQVPSVPSVMADVIILTGKSSLLWSLSIY